MSGHTEPGRRRFHSHQASRELNGALLAIFDQRLTGYMIDLLFAAMIWSPLEFRVATVRPASG